MPSCNSGRTPHADSEYSLAMLPFGVIVRRIWVQTDLSSTLCCPCWCWHVCCRCFPVAAGKPPLRLLCRHRARPSFRLILLRTAITPEIPAPPEPAPVEPVIAPKVAAVPSSLDLGEASFQARNYAKAARSFEDYLKKNPGVPKPRCGAIPPRLVARPGRRFRQKHAPGRGSPETFGR